MALDALAPFQSSHGSIYDGVSHGAWWQILQIALMEASNLYCQWPRKFSTQGGKESCVGAGWGWQHDLDCAANESIDLPRLRERGTSAPSFPASLCCLAFGLTALGTHVALFCCILYVLSL